MSSPAFTGAKRFDKDALEWLHFQYALQPASDSFNPLPAAAGLLDPTVCDVLLAPDMAQLLQAAKLYILSLKIEDTAHAVCSHS